MNEKWKPCSIGKFCIHPRVKEITETIAPPSPMLVPRDLSQPRVGYLAHLQRDPMAWIPAAKTPQGIKPPITLSLESNLLRRRKQS